MLKNMGSTGFSVRNQVNASIGRKEIQPTTEVSCIYYSSRIYYTHSPYKSRPIKVLQLYHELPTMNLQVRLAYQNLILPILLSFKEKTFPSIPHTKSCRTKICIFYR
jgi:hypothetical protein